MQKRDRYIVDKKIKRRRKFLRSLPTKAEYVLWQELRRKLLGYKFRRQVSIGKFIVDFYCHELRLVIEVDGPIHEDQIEYDNQRQKFLESRGYIVIRFLNDEVLFDRDVVLQCIEDWCCILDRSICS
ncbi:MAG: DUF559 domain-containing protein [Candidatus Magasanikbacteria bacterium]